MAVITGVQRGTVALTGVASNTATVSAYTLANTILVFSYSGTGALANAQRGLLTGAKTNTTTLTFRRQDTEGTLTVEWQLLEFNTDVSVEDILVEMGPTLFSGTETITAVTASQAFLWTLGLEGDGSTVNNNFYVEWKFNSTTEIAWATQDTATDSIIMAVQVVDFTGCSVQEVSHTETDTEATSFTDTISAVAIADSLLLSTHRDTFTDAGDDLGNHCLRADISATTTVRFLRGLTTEITYVLNYFVVEFSDGTSLQQGLHTVADLDLQDDITITAVTLAETGVVSGSSSNWTSHGSCADTTDGVDDQRFTFDLTSTTNLQVTRGASDLAQDLAWQVVEFNAAAAAAPPQPRRFDYKPILAA